MASRKRAKIAQRSRRRRPLAAQPSNPYRFSTTFIRRMTVILCTAIVAIPGAGIVYGLTLGSDYEPWQGALATGLLIGGFVVPLVTASVLGGEAIRRGGGFVGFLFAAGLIAGPTGSTLGIRWLAIVGYVALGASVVLFFVIGFASKVPIWFGPPRSKVVSWNDPDDPNT